MMDQELGTLRYPIGRRDPARRANTPERIAECLAVLEALPDRLQQAVKNMSDAQLDTPYRAEGWTVRQLVHHVADSHMNALIRFKWALTEDGPTIKPYAQDAWAAMHDALTMPVASSLAIVAGVHARLADIVRNMSLGDFQRGFVHPETQREQKLEEVLEIYAWHSEHHLAHITGLRERMGWA